VIEQSVFGHRGRTKARAALFCRTGLALSVIATATLGRVFAVDLLQMQQNEIFGSI
jgi:hypothetical protein